MFDEHLIDKKNVWGYDEDEWIWVGGVKADEYDMAKEIENKELP